MDETLIERAIAALERSAEATEKMLAIATDEQLVMQEPGPPICVHCGKVNPTVTMLEADGGSGPLSEFVLVGETHCCNRTLYAVPIGYDTVGTVEAAENIMTMKGGHRE